MANGLSPASPVDVADTETRYSEIVQGTSLHKALDFSNVGMPSRSFKGAVIPTDEYYLRQYHQTRIFVYGFSGMLGHGSALGQKTYLISANLPESINYSMASNWGEPLGGFKHLGFNTLVQVLSNSNLGKGVKNFARNFIGLNVDQGDLASGINRAMTLKVWNGSNPLKLDLEIPVIDDGYDTSPSVGGVSANLTEALEFLGSLCLPSGTDGLGFYRPPPSPLTGGLTWGKGEDATQLFKFSTTYGRIMVQLGGIMLIDRCIITGIDVNYPKTKTLIKHDYSSKLTGASTLNDSARQTYLAPLLAKVTIHVETIEAMTSTNYSKMLWLKQQAGAGDMNTDLKSMFTLPTGSTTPSGE